MPKGPEGIEANFQFALGKTKRKKYGTVASAPPPTEEQPKPETEEKHKKREQQRILPKGTYRIHGLEKSARVLSKKNFQKKK